MRPLFVLWAGLLLFLALGFGPRAARGDENKAPNGLSQYYNPDGVIKMLEIGLQNIDRYRTYTYTFVRQERIGDKLQPEESIALKVRHRPFSTYMYWFDDPKLNQDRSGRELLYVSGANDGKMAIHLGPLDSLFMPVRTIWIDPNDPLIQARARHPVTKVGLKNLLESLHEQFLLAKKNGDLTAENGSVTEDTNLWFTRDESGKQELPMAIQVVRRLPKRENYYCQELTLHLDPRTCFPLRAKTRDWDGSILEIYTYKEVKRASLTAEDFDPANKGYHFK